MKRYMSFVAACLITSVAAAAPMYPRIKVHVAASAEVLAVGLKDSPQLFAKLMEGANGLDVIETKYLPEKKGQLQRSVFTFTSNNTFNSIGGYHCNLKNRLEIEAITEVMPDAGGTTYTPRAVESLNNAVCTAQELSETDPRIRP
jgi:hypothetical protein